MEIYKQSNKYKLIAACLLWLCAALTQAVASQQLFESEVVVQSQAPALRAAALKSALEEVLVRVAGQDSVLQTQPAQALLQKPSRLVQHYRYFTVPDSQPPILKLWVRFDGDTITQSLQAQGLAPRTSERPDTLAWLAVDDRGKQYVVSADDETDVHRQIAAVARARSVPILFPLMDIEDQSRARFADIWGGSFEQTLEASARYKPQAILIGRLQRSPSGGWSSYWFIDVAGKTASWSNSEQQLVTLLQQGIDDTADHLSSQFAMMANRGTANVVSISVAGVKSLAAYARVSNYLVSLASVIDLQVEQISGPRVQYRLQLGGSLQELTRTVSIGTVLEPVAGTVPGEYRLRQ